MRKKILLDKGKKLIDDNDFIHKCNNILKIHPDIVKHIINIYDNGWEEIKNNIKDYLKNKIDGYDNLKTIFNNI
jgi:hypothetical protein